MLHKKLHNKYQYSKYVVKLFTILLFVFFISCIVCNKAEKTYAASKWTLFKIGTVIVVASDYGHDSVISFENSIRVWASGSEGGGIFTAINCVMKTLKLTISCIKAMMSFDFGSIQNSCLPYTIGSDGGKGCENLIPRPRFSAGDIANVVFGVMVMIAAAIASGPIGIFLMIAQLMPIIITCITTYVVTPAEYFMAGGSKDQKDGEQFRLSKLPCKKDASGKIVIDSTNFPNDRKYLDVNSVPFFYSCEPDTESGMYKKGFPGKDTDYCTTADGLGMSAPNLAYKIVVGVASFWKVFERYTEYCDFPVNEDDFYVLDPAGRSLELMAQKFYAFYRISSGGKIQLCAAAATLLMPIPIVVGCSYVPPPQETFVKDKELEKLAINTTCEYILPGRKRDDLSKVADHILTTYKDTNSVYLFLKSDFHIISTTVGCLYDLMSMMMIANVEKDSDRKTFMVKVQENLKNIVLGILLLYVTLIGYKMLINPRPPSKDQLVIFPLKFAIVLMVATTNLWGSPSDGGWGIYEMLTSVTQELPDIFMQTRNSTDPVKMCFYEYDGSNILSQRVLNISESSRPIRMSVWDYLDCVLITYLNFNSCNFTIGGILSFWFVACALFSGGTGFIFSIVMLMYSALMLSVLLRFVHITILTLFIITVLIVLSPIMVCFLLFDMTKDITINWFKMLIGYMLYPGFLFAFLALMLSTLDSAFYGIKPTDIEKVCPPESKHCSMNQNILGQICGPLKERKSIYCALLYLQLSEAQKAAPSTATSVDVSLSNCSAKSNKLDTLLTSQVTYPIIDITTTVFKPFVVDMFFDSVLKVMLFALLFFSFSQTVADFLARLLMIQSISDHASGGSMGTAAAGGMLKLLMPVKASLHVLKAGTKAVNNKNKKRAKEEGEGDSQNTKKRD